jgi:CRP-like cAMP-binding protein
MADPGIAAVSVDLRSQFLHGLIPAQRRTVLTAATQCRFVARSVMTNRGHPAQHFFLLTKGLARFIFVTEDGTKLLFQWIGPGDLFGGRTVLSSYSSYLFSTENGNGQLGVSGDRPTIRDLVARYPRLLENALLNASDYVAWLFNFASSLIRRRPDTLIIRQRHRPITVIPVARFLLSRTFWHFE